MKKKSKHILNFNKNNWKTSKLGDYIREVNETSKNPSEEGLNCIVGLEHIDSGTIHLKRSAELNNTTTFTKVFRKGQILFGRRRAYLKKAAQANFDGICSGDITVMEAKEGLLPELLPFLIHNDRFFDFAIKNSAGSLSPRVKFKDLAEHEFLLPPKEEQTKLAKLLWAADNVVEKDKALLEKLEVVKDIFFLDIIKREKANEIPLSEVLILKKDKSQPPHKIKKYIGLENVNSGEFQCLSFSESKEVKAICNVISSGDICYSKLRPYLDKAFIASFEAVCTTELLVFDVISGIRKEYVLYYLHSMPFIKYASENGFGTKMPRINEEIIGKYPIKNLSEKEQNELIGELASVEKSNFYLKSKLQSSQALLKSLINEIFGG